MTPEDRPDAGAETGVPAPGNRPPFRLAVASLSGQSDADWARAAAPYVGGAFLGGIALDDPTRAAARHLIARDRDEFLPPDPVAFVDDQLDGSPTRRCARRSTSARSRPTPSRGSVPSVRSTVRSSRSTPTAGRTRCARQGRASRCFAIPTASVR